MSFGKRPSCEMRLTLNTDGLIGSIAIGPEDPESWRQCSVSVRAWGFSADYSCCVRSEELHALLREIDAAIANLGQITEIDFGTLERGIRLKLTLDKRGHLEGCYEFSRDWRGPSLSGAFSADQTHLVGWAWELRAALTERSD